MPKRYAKYDDVLVRGEVIHVDDDGFARVKFPGYQWPITIHPDAIEQVFKYKPPKTRPPIDRGD